MSGFYRFVRAVVSFLSMLFFRVKFYGKENIPETGGIIAAGNHRCGWDAIFVARGISKRQIFFMGKAEFFDIPILKHAFRALGAYPVRRGRGDTSALDAAIDVVNKGNIMGIFPEGTRNMTEELKPQTGVSVIAAASGGDVLPISIYFKGKISLFKKVTVRFGKPIKNSELCSSTVMTSKERKAAAKLIMDRIADMYHLGHEQ